jgi:hypothetical protein
MSDVLACTYRYVAQGENGPVRVVLRPGSKVDQLPKDVQEQLRKDNLVVDEKRLTKDNVRLPYGHPDREVAVPEPESETKPVEVQSDNDKDDSNSKTNSKK